MKTDYTYSPLNNSSLSFRIKAGKPILKMTTMNLEGIVKFSKTFIEGVRRRPK